MNHEVDCRHCGRYLFTATSTTVVEQLPCSDSRCKAKLNIKVVNSFSDIKDIMATFKTEEQPPKQKEIDNV